MKKIVLFCSQGMSTSMIVKKMQEAAKEKGFNYDICAYGLSEVETVASSADYVLLGPQIRFQLDRVKSYCKCDIEVIDSRRYGLMDGASIIEHIYEKIGD